MDFLFIDKQEKNICIMNALPSGLRARLGHCL
jgi:hypothetical protein